MKILCNNLGSAKTSKKYTKSILQNHNPDIACFQELKFNAKLPTNYYGKNYVTYSVVPIYEQKRNAKPRGGVAIVIKNNINVLKVTEPGEGTHFQGRILRVDV